MSNLQHVDNDKSEIVLLRDGWWQPGAEFTEQTLREFDGCNGLVGANELFEFPIAECFTSGVLGFGNTVSVEKKTISGSDLQLAGRVVAVHIQAEEKSVALDAGESAVGRAPAQEGRMSGGGIASNPGRNINPQVRGRHQLSTQVAGQSVTQTAKYLGGIAGAAINEANGNLDHRGDERSRYAVSADVGDKKPDTLFIEGEEFIKVTGNGCHGFVRRGDAQLRELRDALRKYGQLKLSVDLEFVIDRKEPPFHGENHVEGDISEGE